MIYLNDLKSIYLLVLLLVGLLTSGVASAQESAESWIRINQLGYLPEGVKVAVLGAKTENVETSTFALVDAESLEVVFTREVGKNFGEYGPFTSTYRLYFSDYSVPGTYYLKAGSVQSPAFEISEEIYEGLADFALKYMRQQRCGYNPYLKDSCHTRDGYPVYGPMSEEEFIDVTGGWHDASDYLQYSTTSANATYHLLAAYRDFPEVFTDFHLANGLEGRNGVADVLDEAQWGLDWLQKMHPRPDWLFNQIADDRDHQGLRLPDQDTINYGYGPGEGRPVYFLTGEPQGLGKYQNRATGTASTAGKFSSAFALAAKLLQSDSAELADIYQEKALSAYQYGLAKPGVGQTAPNRAPYFYEEDNWVDDMELGAVSLYHLTGEESYAQQARLYGEEEPVTPWMGADTARHYQWYPFHNFGHYELAKASEGDDKGQLIEYYREGIERVWQKAQQNAFYRGIPFIWCSNNLTTSFAIQCYLYRELSGDTTYLPLEQACFDWLFGTNPWGTSMVVGLPEKGDTPVDPHSVFTYLYQYPVDGGLVDGPVYGSIYNNLIGIQLVKPDEYAPFQSDLVVYHDDFGDYSTNEPTMDGTASLIYLLAAKESSSGEGAAAGKK